jgi:hypothetical protein
MQDGGKLKAALPSHPPPTIVNIERVHEIEPWQRRRDVRDGTKLTLSAPTARR